MATVRLTYREFINVVSNSEKPIRSIRVSPELQQGWLEDESQEDTFRRGHLVRRNRLTYKGVTVRECSAGNSRICHLGSDTTPLVETGVPDRTLALREFNKKYLLGLIRCPKCNGVECSGDIRDVVFCANCTNVTIMKEVAL